VTVAEQAAAHNFTVANNTFQDLIKGTAGGNAGILTVQTTGGPLNGTISGNVIGNATSGNGDRRGIDVIAEPDVPSTANSAAWISSSRTTRWTACRTARHLRGPA